MGNVPSRATCPACPWLMRMAALSPLPLLPPQSLTPLPLLHLLNSIPQSSLVPLPDPLPHSADLHSGSPVTPEQLPLSASCLPAQAPCLVVAVGR